MIPIGDRKDVSLCHSHQVSYDRSASGADLNCACMMPLTSLRLGFRKSVNDRRLRGLARALDGIQPEIEKESQQLRQARKRVMDCAAFSLEAMENGEESESMSAKLDVLARDLATNRARLLLLEQQSLFLAKIRAGLQRLLQSHRA